MKYVGVITHMAKTKQKQIFDSSTSSSGGSKSSGDVIAIGTVVDTNDPMQWGRLRVVVPAWGDSWNHEVESMPWAMYVSPIAGQTSVGTRGAGINPVEGGVAYGMWSIPKIGAQVVMMSLDEDHQQRLYIGCIFDAFVSHTLPHGRWMFDDHPALDGGTSKAAPFGPFSSGEKLIQPLSNNMRQAFSNAVECKEWQTRSADYTVSRVDVSQLQYTKSKVQDDKAIESADGWISTQGYQTSRIDPLNTSTVTDKNYDSHTHSWTTPGFHSISMDDRMENCRMRFRTTSGHQLLMDDTNERIYISTAKGNNWVEMDQAGNIDIFTTNKVSIHAANEINMTSDKTIRMYAKEGIHMNTPNEIRMHADADIHVDTKAKLHIKSEGDMNIKTGSTLMLTSASTSNINAGGNILMTAPKIHHNGPAAKKSDDAQISFFTNRIPTREPFQRCMTKSDVDQSPAFSYDSSKNNKEEYGIEIPRGVYWRR
jgi:hypothetical protein